VAQSGGQGIGHVVRLRRGVESQLALDGPLHLHLAWPLPVSIFLICVAL
jgi:hypothetical protein